MDAYTIDKQTVMGIANSESFQIFLAEREIQLDNLRWLPPIPWNIRSACIATDKWEIKFDEAIGLFHPQTEEGEQPSFVIVIYDIDSYAIYPNIRTPDRNRESRWLSEVYPDAKAPEPMEA